MADRGVPAAPSSAAFGNDGGGSGRTGECIRLHRTAGAHRPAPTALVDAAAAVIDDGDTTGGYVPYGELVEMLEQG